MLLVDSRHCQVDSNDIPQGDFDCVQKHSKQKTWADLQTSLEDPRLPKREALFTQRTIVCDVGCNPIEGLAEVAKNQEGGLDKQGTPWVQTVEPKSANPVVGEEMLEVQTLMPEAIGEVSEDCNVLQD